MLYLAQKDQTAQYLQNREQLETALQNGAQIFKDESGQLTLIADPQQGWLEEPELTRRAARDETLEALSIIMGGSHA